MSMGDKIAVLNEGAHRAGRHAHVIYNHPHDLFVATFVGLPAMNILDGEVEDGRVIALSGSYSAAVPEAARKQVSSGARVKLGIRSENVMVGPTALSPRKSIMWRNHGVEQIRDAQGRTGTSSPPPCPGQLRLPSATSCDSIWTAKNSITSRPIRV